MQRYGCLAMTGTEVSGGVVEATICIIADPAAVLVRARPCVKYLEVIYNHIHALVSCIIQGGGGGCGRTGGIGPRQSPNEGCTSMETANICTEFVKIFSTSGMASTSTTTTVSDTISVGMGCSTYANIYCARRHVLPRRDARPLYPRR